MYDNAHDANMRLSESIVIYDGTPVFVHEVRDNNGGIEAVFSRLDNREDGRASITDAGWDISPVSLGYVNYNGSTYYLQRAPTRRWKQGLNRENVEILSRGGTGLGRDASPRDLINTSSMSDCILNQYLPLDEAIALVRGGRATSIAYNRAFAFSKDTDTGLLWLWYKSEKVGWVEGQQPVLGDRFQYLAEELQETLT